MQVIIKHSRHITRKAEREWKRSHSQGNNSESFFNLMNASNPSIQEYKDLKVKINIRKTTLRHIIVKLKTEDKNIPSNHERNEASCLEENTKADTWPPGAPEAKKLTMLLM